MAGACVAFSLTLPFLHPAFFPNDPRAKMYVALGAAGVVGATSACGAVIARSLMADVIDWDERQTGTRREGAYFAWFSFLGKSGNGADAMVMGWLLDLVGFVPNAEQTMLVKLTMAGLFSILPMIGFTVAFTIFGRHWSLIEETVGRAGIMDAAYEPPRDARAGAAGTRRRTLV